MTSHPLANVTRVTELACWSAPNEDEVWNLLLIQKWLGGNWTDTQNRSSGDFQSV